MKSKIKCIKKDKERRKEFLKKEIKKIIFKSIIQNLAVKPKIRALAVKKNNNIKKFSSISKQNNNLCLKSGRFKGVLKKTNLCRHEMKKLIITGSLQNIKISSW